MIRKCALLALALSFFATPLHAEEAAILREKRPDLFHPETGLRIAKQRAPIPDDIPAPARRVGVEQAKALLLSGAIAIDVFGALQSRFDELDGTWLIGKEHKTIPGAVWLPETGRGVLQPQIKAYLKSNLQTLTNGQRTTPLIVFCVSDCWMSWNASQHIARLGYSNVNWFALGTDGWEEAGGTLVPVTPIPVDVD
ncbi:MAG: PQQ-dependent catabolism-associated CXXCW motif protein [Ahrensia sp.]|nr:PQQ-dependent catabolism-associated CXXCW motif protein [Ahrensia sp.]